MAMPNHTNLANIYTLDISFILNAIVATYQPSPIQCRNRECTRYVASLTEHLSSLRSSAVARARVAQIWPSQFPALWLPMLRYCGCAAHISVSKSKQAKIKTRLDSGINVQSTNLSCRLTPVKTSSIQIVSCRTKNQLADDDAKQTLGAANIERWLDD